MQWWVRCGDEAWFELWTTLKSLLSCANRTRLPPSMHAVSDSDSWSFLCNSIADHEGFRWVLVFAPVMQWKETWRYVQDSLHRQFVVCP